MRPLLLGLLSSIGPLARADEPSPPKLNQAARSAKDAGLDLGVDSKLEGWLLDPTTDPQQPAPGAL